MAATSNGHWELPPAARGVGTPIRVGTASREGYVPREPGVVQLVILSLSALALPFIALRAYKDANTRPRRRLTSFLRRGV